MTTVRKPPDRETTQEVVGSAPDLSERRTAPRYSPDPLVPVLFAHPEAETPTAGLIADVSNGGARIVAPPTARPHLHWGDPLTIMISYSDSAREAGIEGMTLNATVVRLAVDASGFVLQARFDRTNGDWTSLEGWIRQLAA
ncbi:MAG: PilZ domain-containing protein [Myxococcota bacterium]